jgi:lysophospholipase L1-like esterase
MEATAEWATHESLRSGTGATLYASNLNQFLEDPERALNTHEGLGGGRQYGSFILASYLTEAVSRNFVLDTWQVMDSAGTPVAAIRYTANYYGRGMDELLLGFAVANYRLDQPTDMTFSLGARDGYNDSHAGSVWRDQLTGGRPARTVRSLSWGSSTAGTAQVGPGGATYVELNPQGNGQGRLTVNVTASSGFRYAVFTSTGGSGRPDMTPLDHSQNRGSGQVVVSIEEGETAALVATRTTLIQDSSDADEDRASISWNARLTASGGGDGDNIMVVGDSITHGNEGSYSWRFPLDRHLEIAGESIDFVGPRVGSYDIYTDIRNRAILDGQEPPPQVYYPGPSTARYMNNDFDRNHNAMWGWTFADANNTIQRDIEQHHADYLLIALGFNDITWEYSDAPGTVASARRMVMEARSANPEIKILISNVVTRTPLPGFEWLNGEIREYGDLLEDEVGNLSTSRSPVHLVDISSDFDPYNHAWDGLHPNAQGDYFIASKFANALHSEFGMGAPYGNVPSPIPDVQLGQVDWVAAGVTDQGFRLSWAREFGASGYYIWTRNATLAEPWELLPLPAPGDYLRSTWVRDGDTYEFRVAPVRGDQVGPISPVASAVAAPKTLPGPSNVTAIVDGRDVLVEWDHRGGATGYRVYWIEAVGDYPVMRHEYVEARGDDRYWIRGLTPGMEYNVGVSTVNYYGPGIPTGVLNDVVIPGTLAAQETDPTVAVEWTPGTEALQGLGESWEGYPEGSAPIIGQDRAADLTEDLLGSDAPDFQTDDRVVNPVAPRREENE